MPNDEQFTELRTELKEKIAELEKKINEKITNLEDLELKLNEVKSLLKTHTHSGMETSGRLEPLILKLNIIDAAIYKVSGTAGVDGIFTSADTPPKTIEVEKGIITSITT